MKKCVFVSDFDGTITKKDFFLIYIDMFLGERGRKYLADYRMQNNASYEFLNNVFAMRSLKHEEYQQLLEEIRWDAYFPKFLKELAEMQIDHIILSAGIAFYVRDALAFHGMPEQRVISNDGEFAQDGFIRLYHDLDSPIFSPQYGVDKGKAIQMLRKEYDFIYFAGDSLPDIPAAEEADVVFAKSNLKHYFEEHNPQRIIAFDSYEEIANYLKNERK